MMNAGVNAFVVAVVVLNLAACAWLMWWTARMRNPSSDQSSQDATAKTGHVWDGDLEEYNNPLPRWWLGLFIVSMIFGIGYLVLYPGLGNYAGVSNWSSQQEFDANLAHQSRLFEERMASLKDKSPIELAGDAGAMSTARNLFAANCSGCHGSDARGARGFPNLTDRDWLWGGDAATIKESIAHGRHGVMPAWGSVLGDTGVNEVASYVVSLSSVQAPADWVEAGKSRFSTLCASCHGVDAKGNQALGAPNLTDKTWLHGGDFAAVKATIASGRDNQMPAHGSLLGESKVRLLSAYVLSLSHSEPQAVSDLRVLSDLRAGGAGHDAAP